MAREKESFKVHCKRFLDDRNKQIEMFVIVSVDAVIFVLLVVGILSEERLCRLHLLEIHHISNIFKLITNRSMYSIEIQLHRNQKEEKNPTETQ